MLDLRSFECLYIGCVCVIHSVVSDSLQTHGLYTRLVCLWNYPGKNTGVGCHSFLQGTFPTQGLNLGFLHCKQPLFHLIHKGSPVLLVKIKYMKSESVFWNELE